MQRAGAAGPDEEDFPASKRMHAAPPSRAIEREWLYRRNRAHGFYNGTPVARIYGSVVAFLDGDIGKAGSALGPGR